MKESIHFIHCSSNVNTPQSLSLVRVIDYNHENHRWKTQKKNQHNLLLEKQSHWLNAFRINVYRYSSRRRVKKKLWFWLCVLSINGLLHASIQIDRALVQCTNIHFFSSNHTTFLAIFTEIFWCSLLKLKQKPVANFHTKNRVFFPRDTQ